MSLSRVRERALVDIIGYIISSQQFLPHLCTDVQSTMLLATWCYYTLMDSHQFVLFFLDDELIIHAWHLAAY